MARRTYIYLALLLVGVSVKAQPWRGIWSVGNPALAAGTGMTWVDDAQVIGNVTQATVELCRKNAGQLNLVRVLYDWLPDEEWAARKTELVSLFQGNKLILPEIEWSRRWSQEATDPKRFLDWALKSKEAWRHPVLTPAQRGREKVFTVETVVYPGLDSLVISGKNKGELAFTTNLFAGANSSLGVIIWVEHELIGGIFSAEGKTVRLPLCYTPFVRICL